MWTKQKIFWFICLIVAMIISVYAQLNVGVGKHKTVKGIVVAVGMDTSARYELPIPIISVRLENKKVVNIEVERNFKLKKGDIVVLNESSRLLSSGKDYKFEKVEK